MNEAGKYIREMSAFHTPFKFTEAEVKAAVNKALEQVRKEAKEKLHRLIFDNDKWLDAISHKDFDKIITNLNL